MPAFCRGKRPVPRRVKTSNAARAAATKTTPTRKRAAGGRLAPRLRKAPGFSVYSSRTAPPSSDTGGEDSSAPRASALAAWSQPAHASTVRRSRPKRKGIFIGRSEALFYSQGHPLLQELSSNRCSNAKREVSMPGSQKVWSALLVLLAVSSRLPAQPEADLEAKAATLISLNSRVIDTSRPEPESAEALRAEPADPREGEIVLVKFPRPATARQMKALRATSLRVYAY